MSSRPTGSLPMGLQRAVTKICLTVGLPRFNVAEVGAALAL